MNRGSFFMLPCLLFVILQFVFPAGVPASALACPLGGRDAGPCARRAVSMPVSLCVPLPACRFPGLPVRVPAGMPACRQAGILAVWRTMRRAGWWACRFSCPQRKGHFPVSVSLRVFVAAFGADVEVCGFFRRFRGSVPYPNFAPTTAD